jgi:hypothetical protein
MQQTWFLQVCSYRCIASHESPALEHFSLCILQKHNCLGLNAAIPTRPDPQPMAHFRGAPLSHEAAEAIFLGWIGALLAISHTQRKDTAPVLPRQGRSGRHKTHDSKLR